MSEEPRGATRGQLVHRAMKAAGGFPAPKGYRTVGYSLHITRDVGGAAVYKIVADITRTYSHHMTGKVYERVIAKGLTFEQTLAKASERIKTLREKE